MQSKCQRKLPVSHVNSPLYNPTRTTTTMLRETHTPLKPSSRQSPSTETNTSTHTHKKNFRYSRYRASQQRNTSEAQARSQRRISTPSLLSTTCSQCFDQATSKTLTQLIDLIGLPVDLQYRYCKLDLQLPVDLAVTTDRSTVPEPPY